MRGPMRSTRPLCFLSVAIRSLRSWHGTTTIAPLIHVQGRHRMIEASMSLMFLYFVVRLLLHGLEGAKGVVPCEILGRSWLC